MGGTHVSNFYHFCNGKLDLYYLRKHLELRPNLNGCVEANLPDSCAVSSDKPLPANEPTLTPPASAGGNSNSTGKTKRKRAESNVAMAIRDFQNSQMRAEL